MPGKATSDFRGGLPGFPQQFDGAISPLNRLTIHWCASAFPARTPVTWSARYVLHCSRTPAAQYVRRSVSACGGLTISSVLAWYWNTGTRGGWAPSLFCASRACHCGVPNGFDVVKSLIFLNE